MQEQPVNAWIGAEERYRPGQEVQGTVTRIAPFGVFVEVEPGIEGIMYSFELGPGAMAEMVHGQPLLLSVGSIDIHKKRLELRLANQSMPGPLTEQQLPPAVRRQKDLSIPPGSLSMEDLLPQAEHAALPETPLPFYEHHCSTCQQRVQPRWKYCVYCGENLQRLCQTCGTLQPALPEARYCCECGQLLS